MRVNIVQYFVSMQKDIKVLAKLSEMGHSGQDFHIRDHRIKTSDFFGHIRPCSFDLLTVTFQGQTFLDKS